MYSLLIDLTGRSSKESSKKILRKISCVLTFSLKRLEKKHKEAGNQSVEEPKNIILVMIYSPFI